MWNNYQETRLFHTSICLIGSGCLVSYVKPGVIIWVLHSTDHSAWKSFPNIQHPQEYLFFTNAFSFHTSLLAAVLQGASLRQMMKVLPGCKWWNETRQLPLLLESSGNKMDSVHMLVWCHGIVIKPLTIQAKLLIFLSRKKLMTFMHCDSEVLAPLMGSASNATKLILLYNVSRCRPFKCLQSVQQGILWTPIAEEGNVVFHFPIPLPSFGKTGKLWSCNKTWYYIHAKMNDRRNHRLLLDGACHTQKYMIYAFE